MEEKLTEQIPVTFLPYHEEEKRGPIRVPKKTKLRIQRHATRPFQTHTRIAKTRRLPPVPKPKSPEEPPKREQPSREPTKLKREVPRQTIRVPRPLLTLKELLPPATWSLSGEGTTGEEKAVRLDTDKPRYVSYFASIKRAIELVWNYPQAALTNKLQGRLILKFTILKNGHLERTRLISSSGFTILDEEAVRAVRAASPFHPIPPWIRKTRLAVIASFEYEDNRLKYGFIP